jgi:(1->4)-alpha-D-glucan 1-alpha-D-glucosylmutase
MEYLLYQTLAGAWPLDQERMHGYAEKAAREAKTHTSWTRVNAEYEEALHSFVSSLYQDAAFLAELEALVQDIAYPGYVNSLAQTLLKLTCPGVPDLYQGTELWDFSLVDPDNRRPVKYSTRRDLLAQTERLTAREIMDRTDEGLPKLWLIRQGLSLRRRLPEAFGPAGSYAPLRISGEKAEHALAFARGEHVVSLLTRLPLTFNGRWEDTTISLPQGGWRDLLTNTRIQGGDQAVRGLLQSFPVALLLREE